MSKYADTGGIDQATNTGLQASVGRYIALQDSDDIALPCRLETQARLMNEQPRLSILGGQMECFDASEAKPHVPRDDATIKTNLLAGCSNIHNPTAMLRRDFLCAHDLKWGSSERGAFDWAFYVKAMLLGAKFANTPSSVVRYRVDQQSRDQRGIRATKAAIRLRVVEAFFPHLTECEALEPLLQWAAPPLLSPDKVLEGLTSIVKAQAPLKTQRGSAETPSIAIYLRANSAGQKRPRHVMYSGLDGRPPSPPSRPLKACP